MYDRQDFNVPPSISVVGVGGVGANVAIYAAMAGVPVISVFDSDNVEEVNLSRLPYPESWIGKPKVDAVEEFIHNIRPNCVVLKHPNYDGFLRDELIGTIIITADKASVRRELLTDEKLNKEHLVLNGAYNKDTITISRAPPWGEDHPYEIIPSWIGTASIVASLLLAQAFGIAPTDMDFTGKFWWLTEK